MQHTWQVHIPNLALLMKDQATLLPLDGDISREHPFRRYCPSMLRFVRLQNSWWTLDSV